VISIPVSSKRTERKHAIEETRVRFEALPESLPGMDTGGDFTGTMNPDSISGPLHTLRSFS
jgi:hypothetical protein